ncbi:MAG TPA: sigma-54 dependent transcriptional regulator [Desulfuromonadaceae bacterium]
MIDLKNLTILLAEDEAELRRETAAFLELYCGRILPAANGREALALFEGQRPDLVISDIRMPVMDGLELAARLKERGPDTPLIFCTAFTETAYLLRAIELGATAFVRKPVDTEDLLAAIAKAALPVIQRREINGLSAELTASVAAQMGDGAAMRTIAELAAHVARTPFSVLLQGETGSGKSRLAGIIHSLSPRREGPFVPVNLGAIPEHLAESELFGHLRGAFTGAERTRAGFVEAAQGGTLFLDDIESCPAAVQVKLLRLVEEKRFTPVGSAAEKRADVRVIAASNRNLKEEAAAGRFREDLYYRLADVVIPLPPLRETPDAIVPLALRFLRETSDELRRDAPLLDPEARRKLVAMPWPGNVRQLKSAIRRTMLTAGAVITDVDIAAATSDQESCMIGRSAPESAAASPPPFPCSMDDLEKWSLEQALGFCGGKRMKAALMLGMNYYTFRRRLERHGISPGEEEPATSP